ncbi:MAG: hypothetical protein JSV33_08105 [bacterium]|nr:MAG: hypothetical protein JSV33_08105 [bacterium]
MNDTISSRSIAPAYFLAGILPIVYRLGIGSLMCDDAYITMRFAHNLAHHGQFVFNLGNPIFACTTLSYGLLVAGLTALGISTLTASWIITLAADVAVCILLVRSASLISSNVGLAYVSPIAWLLHPITGLNTVSGMETSIALVAFIWLAIACYKGRFGIALILLSIMVWIRIDAVVAAPVLVYCWLRSGRPRIHLSPVIVAILIGVVYLIVTKYTYGTVLPQSAIAKARHQGGDLPGAIIVALSFIVSVCGINQAWFWYVAIHLPLLPALAVVFYRWRRLHRLEQILLLLAIAHAAAFILSGRRNTVTYLWYYVPFPTLLLVPALHVVSDMQHRLGAHVKRNRVVVVASVLCFVCAVFCAVVGALNIADAAVMRLLPSAVLENPQRIEPAMHALRANVWLLCGITLSTAVWLAALCRRNWSRRTMLAAAFIIALATGLFSLHLNRRRLLVKYERREEAYLQIGTWAAENLNVGEWIAAHEIGAIGWASLGHPLFDAAGLVTPEAFELSIHEWAPRWNPALIAHMSTSERREPDDIDTPEGYTPFLFPHNLVLVRDDLVERWRASPPELR